MAAAVREFAIQAKALRELFLQTNNRGREKLWDADSKSSEGCFEAEISSLGWCCRRCSYLQQGNLQFHEKERKLKLSCSFRNTRNGAMDFLTWDG